MDKIITITLLLATVLVLGEITDAARRSRQTNYQTANKNGDLNPHNPLQSLPRFYLDAAKELELSDKQISEIAQKHEIYLITTRQEQEDYGEKFQVLHTKRTQVEQNNRWSDVKNYTEAIRNLIADHKLLQNKRYAELQKAIMGILPSKNRKQWAGMLFASEAIRPFRAVMEDRKSVV